MKSINCDQRRRSNESGSTTLVSTNQSLNNGTLNNTLSRLEDHACFLDFPTRPTTSSTLEMESYKTCTEGTENSKSIPPCYSKETGVLDNITSDSHENHSGQNLDVFSNVTASVPTDVIHRSFARQKQVKELLNTERIYIQSLKVLSNTYIQGMMADLETPIYFRTFKDSIQKMINSHMQFLDEITRVYVLWGKSATNTFNSMESIAATSPDYDNFQMPFNEAPYLKKIFTLISEQAIDVSYYCTYCSLLSRVLNFSKEKNVEKYKRLSIRIVNDYLIKHAEAEMPEYMTSQALDTRFISLIQMPTARITRYALIVRSLLDKLKSDDSLNEVGPLGEKVIDQLAEKCLDVNSFIGKAQEKQNKMKLFEQVSSGCIEKVMSKLFLDNLGAPEFVGGYGTIWMQNNQLYYEPLAVFLFNKHLVCLKLHQFRYPEIVFLIPLISILNNFKRDEILATRLYSKYPFQIKLRFENHFKEYEICFIFPSHYEMNTWQAKFSLLVEQLKCQLPNGNYPYSKLVQQYNESIEKNLPFVLQIYCPNNLDWYKSQQKDKFVLNTTIFVVKHFLTRINRCDQKQIIVAARDQTHESTILIHIRRDHRTLLEKELGALWSKELPLYHLEGSVFVKSTSMINLRSRIGTETQSLFSHFSLNTRRLKKQQLKNSYPNGLKNIVRLHPRIDCTNVQLKTDDISRGHLMRKFVSWAKVLRFFEPEEIQNSNQTSKKMPMPKT